MALTRTFDATLLNSVANLPHIRPLLGGGKGVIDLSPELNNVNNIAMTYKDHGGFLATRISEKDYEVHTIFGDTPDFAVIMAAAREFLEYLFTRTLAEAVYTKCPLTNPGTATMANKLGFSKWYEGHVDPVSEDIYTVYCLTLDRWAVTCSNANSKGKDFHNLLDVAREAMDGTTNSHPEDLYHDHVVGASILMASRGMVMKAVDFYNKWATISKYAPVVIHSAFPLVVDIHDAVLEISDGNIKVLKCR